MICEKCQTREATVFLTQFIDGQMHKVDLCEKCAKEMGVTHSAGFSLADLLLKDSAGKADEPGDLTACPSCGFTQQQLVKTGRLGCPVCYETFENVVQNALRDMQRSTRHTGKVPQRLVAEMNLVRQRGLLEKALGEAIRSERYEEASKLRDELKALARS
ncbi:MAG: UvrB/UvrC motif-containing protein [Methylacidiphilales bacterium]|nr:UvrB/UvrC motif-containing protein [Candidatus Methylacidiphilales bacterium]